MQPIPVFLPGESHGQKSLTGYNPRGCKELDTIEGSCRTFVPENDSNDYCSDWCPYKGRKLDTHTHTCREEGRVRMEADLRDASASQGMPGATHSQETGRGEKESSWSLWRTLLTP